jgi:anti-sigma factor RsiW
MNRCETIAPLLADFADGAAAPGEAAVVERHARRCTHCRIQLARERRLSQAISQMRDIDVDRLFTQAVLRRIPASLPKRRRDRRGLKLAVLTWFLAPALVLGAPRGSWCNGLPSPSSPALSAEILDPGAGALVALAQTVLTALQTFSEAPAVAATLGFFPALLLLAVALVLLACLAFSSTLLVILVGAYPRSKLPAASA